MSLEFRGIPVNEHAHPGEPLLEELNTKTIYRLNEVIDTPVEIDKIKWIISYDRMGELIFNWGDRLIAIDTDGTIAYEGMIIKSCPPLYLILHDDSFIPPGCSQVDTIELLMS